MRLLQPDVHFQFAGGMFQEAVQQLDQPLLLLQRAQQLAHLLARQVQIQAHQVGRAFHVHFGRGVHVSSRPFR